jgi:hypothetical protein
LPGIAGRSFGEAGRALFVLAYSKILCFMIDIVPCVAERGGTWVTRLFDIAQPTATATANAREKLGFAK